jgi:hypothetical protein
VSSLLDQQKHHAGCSSRGMPHVVDEAKC